nr:metal-dependent transcriptional regulator [Saprospiraceae bacterium]
MQLSTAEENYLKAIFKISEKKRGTVSTKEISKIVETSAASVTDMLKRLAEKNLINYQKYKGVKLSPTGLVRATSLVRKHRLWEVFLVERLSFGWEEVHDIAEQLEHIQSEELVDRLEEHLNYPKFDPHGDPIPDRRGVITLRKQSPISNLELNETGIIVGVSNSDTEFLLFLEDMGLVLGKQITVIKKFDFDNTLLIEIEGKNRQTLSNKVAKNINVQIR